jgi:hypothetical protein
MDEIPLSHVSFSFKGFLDVGHVGLFREPRARLVSAFHYGMHAFGAPEEWHEALKARVKTLQEFVETPQILSCSTKMLLGRACAEDYNVSVSDAAQALRNLDTFAFVGLTEAFNMSVCLFHHMHGGEVFPWEFVTVRDSFSSKMSKATTAVPHGNHTYLRKVHESSIAEERFG